MVNELSQSQLARRLGISGAMTSKLVRRGMPLDEAGAREWRKQNLSPFHCKGRRIDGNSGLRHGQRPTPKMLTAAELVELAEDIGQSMVDPALPPAFDEGLSHLLATLGALARLDEAAVQTLALPQRVADAAADWLEAA